MATCHDCDGYRGMLEGAIGNGECSECHGTGDASGLLEDFLEASGFERDDCSECDGTGECQECDGTGEIDGDD